MQLTYIEDLKSSGLSDDQAVIYELLLRMGMLPASKLALSLPGDHAMSRPQVYKVLDELIVLDLIDKQEKPGKVAAFLPKHPVALKHGVEAKKAEFEKNLQRLEGTFPQLTSLFNLTSGRPGIQYFEGKEGLWQVLEDTLTAKEEILTYADVEAIEKYIPELNAEYVAIREDKNIKKRGLVVDTPIARKFVRGYDARVTTTKLIPASAHFTSFQTIIQIYDNKVAYMTLSDTYLIGIIITDQFIANTHKFLFESMWQITSGEVV